MPEIERDIVFILHNHYDLAIARMRNTCFVQHVGVSLCQITDHKFALNDDLENVVHDIVWSENLVDPYRTEVMMATSAADGLIDIVILRVEWHHHSDMCRDWQGPFFHMEKPRLRNTGEKRFLGTNTISKETKESFKQTALLDCPVRP